jgi:hypothetical protein
VKDLIEAVDDLAAVQLCRNRLRHPYVRTNVAEHRG